MANVIDSLTLGGKTGVLSIPYATCGTAAGTAAKTASVTNFSLETGAQVRVKFTYANTVANPTLNINSSGAKAIYWHGAALPSAQYWVAGAVLDFVYNGAQWDLISDQTAQYLPLAGGNMTGAGPIQYPTDSGNGKYNYYISAGGGYSPASGKYGVKLVCCDQVDCQTGMGQDLTALDGGYELSIAGGRSSNNVGYISFAMHSVNSTTYDRLGYFNNAGEFYTKSTIYEGGTALSNKYAPKSTVANTTLSASGWIGGIYEYTNSAITATNIIELIPAVGITNEQLSALQLANIIGGMQESGCIVLRVMGETPRIDIPVTFIIRGDV